VTLLPTFAAALTLGSALSDPGVAAREVFQNQDFWWKRIETRSDSISTSWLESILTHVLEYLGRVLTRILEFLADLFRNLFGPFGDASSGAALLIWFLVLALLLYAVFRFPSVIMSWLSQTAPAPAAQQVAAWQMLAEASELFEQAGLAFRDGKYAEAIRLALLALIAKLQKQGLLRYDATRTNREYQRELRPASELAACFGQLARIYERVWYGRMSAGRAEAEQAISLCGSVINREDLAPE
jgi:Domain of unknown function (DUF4129)